MNASPKFETYANCKFNDSDQNQCHRNPPAVTLYVSDNQRLIYSPTTWWPEVSASDWCGEWVATPAP